MRKIMAVAQHSLSAPDAVSYVVDHVFLPPKIPCRSDYDPTHEASLLKRTLESLRRFQVLVPAHQYDVVGDAVTQLRRIMDVHECVGDQYVVDQHALMLAMQDLDCEGEGRHSFRTLLEDFWLIITRWIDPPLHKRAERGNALHCLPRG
jgi:hypothetical protein